MKISNKLLIYSYAVVDLDEVLFESDGKTYNIPIRTRAAFDTEEAISEFYKLKSDGILIFFRDVKSFTMKSGKPETFGQDFTIYHVRYGTFNPLTKEVNSEKLK